jgi:hypothetical protein
MATGRIGPPAVTARLQNGAEEAAAGWRAEVIRPDAGHAHRRRCLAPAGPPDARRNWRAGRASASCVMVTRRDDGITPGIVVCTHHRAPLAVPKISRTAASGNAKSEARPSEHVAFRGGLITLGARREARRIRGRFAAAVSVVGGTKHWYKRPQASTAKWLTRLGFVSSA